MEGASRELIRNIQILRKEADFSIEQRIIINLTTKGDTLSETISKFKDKIMTEVLAVEFNADIEENYDISKEIEIMEENVKITLKKAK